jgi:predicted tellurium resistance membrane protein TerC
MEWLLPLITLILLEVVLGLDNVIFISIIAARLPVNQQRKARTIGLILAMLLRLGLLGIISLILKLQGNLFTIYDISISGKDLILIVGGLFLIYKSASEIHHKMEGESGDTSKNINATSFKSVIIQILLLDLVFSIDSIITAVGMVSELWIMYTAVIVSVTIMLFAAGPISGFVNKHPAFKMLALSFLLLIGVSLIAEGLDFHIPKGYIYFSMVFALLVDIIQMRAAKKSEPVATHEHYLPGEKESIDDKL